MSTNATSAAQSLRCCKIWVPLMRMCPVQNVARLSRPNSSHRLALPAIVNLVAKAACVPPAISKVKMITIRCAKCRSKIFKYQKVGKGRLWHCWKDRIIEDYSSRDGNKIKCQCGNPIGIDEGKWIRMKQHGFNFSGSVTRKGKE